MAVFACASPDAGVVVAGVVVVAVERGGSLTTVGEGFVLPPELDRTTATIAAITINAAPPMANGSRLRFGAGPPPVLGGPPPPGCGHPPGGVCGGGAECQAGTPLGG